MTTSPSLIYDEEVAEVARDSDLEGYSFTVTDFNCFPRSSEMTGFAGVAAGAGFDAFFAFRSGSGSVNPRPLHSRQWVVDLIFGAMTSLRNLPVP